MTRGIKFDQLIFQLAMKLYQFMAHRLFSLLPAVTFWCIVWSALLFLRVLCVLTWLALVSYLVL